MTAPLPRKPTKISLYLDPEDLAWLEEESQAALTSKSTIARQVFRAAREAKARAAAVQQATAEERSRLLAEGPVAGDGGMGA